MIENPGLASCNNKKNKEEMAFPLTDLQYAYWIGRRFDQPLGGVGCHTYIELDGQDVDPEKLKNAWHKVQIKHPTFRTIIQKNGTQCVKDDMTPAAVKVNDFRRMSEEECERQLELVRADRKDRLLDIENGEMAGMALSLLPGQKTCLHLDMESIAADMTSVKYILNDLEMFYKQENREADAGSWNFGLYLNEKEQRFRKQMEESKAFWHNKLPSLPLAPDLPVNKEAFHLKAEFTRREFFLEKEEWGQFKSAAMEQMATPAMLLLAIYAAVIKKWSGNKEFLMNITVHEREAELADKDVVADFTDILLLPVGSSNNETFMDSVMDIQETFFELMQYSYYSGVKVQRDLTKLYPEQTFIAPVVFTCGYGQSIIEKGAADTFGRLSYFTSQVPQVWLELQAFEVNDGFLVAWEAVDKIFSDHMIDDMFMAFSQMVRAVTVPNLSWDELRCELPKAQAIKCEQRLPAEIPQLNTGIHWGFFDHYKHHPEKTAVIEGHKDRQFTYREIGDMSLQAAALLVKRGVKRNDAVAISLPRGSRQITAVLGVLSAGASYVPINITQPADRRNRILNSADCKAIIVDDPAAYENLPGGIEKIDISAAENEQPLNCPVLNGGALKAYTIFTSGSTGEPKGVEISHGSAMNTIIAINQKYHMNRDDSILAVSALDFDLSVYDVFGMFTAGGTIVLLTEDERRDAGVWCEYQKTHNITLWNSVPVLLDMLLIECESRQEKLPLLRLTLLSGDWIPLKLPGRLKNIAAGAEFISLGGATEASIWSNYYDVKLPLPQEWVSIPYGYPLANQMFRVVDTAGNDCPDWVAGELVIGGAGVALGYCSDSELDQQKFKSEKGFRWYYTGDTGRYWPDGTIEFLGRLDAQVKIRGHRIELGEIEAALHKNPNIDTAAVVLRTDGQRKNFLAAYYVGKHGAVDEQGLSVYLKEYLPEYMIPSAYLSLPEMPVTENGKINRKALPEITPVNTGSSAFAEPETEIEKQLAGIWRKILKINRIGRNDDYFSLGGDSLMATQLNTKVRDQYQIELGLENIFSNPMLKEQAIIIQQAVNKKERIMSYPQIQPRQERKYESFPLTEIQQAYWLGRSGGYLLGGTGTHLFSEYENVNIDTKHLERAFNRVIARHGMMRTILLPNGEGQITLEKTDYFTFQTVDYRWQSESSIAERLTAMEHEMVAQQFDMYQWPLFDIRTVLLPEDKVRIFVSFDSIVLDGWSLVHLLKEWSVFYEDEKAELPQLDISFRDYVMTMEQLKKSDLYQQDLTYWQERLKTIAPPPELPLKKVPEQILEQQFGHREERLNARLWENIKRRAREMGVTPSAVLLTAYALVLKKWSKNSEFTINLTHFNRLPLHRQINELMGDFTSLTLLSLSYAEEKSFTDQCQLLQRQLWQDLDHSLVCGVVVQRELNKSNPQDFKNGFPVIFTSALGVQQEMEQNVLGRRIYGETQTPQVWLDHQVMETDGELLFCWDSVEELFPDHMLDEMFDAYCGLLQQLAENQDIWRKKTTALIAIERKLQNPEHAEINSGSADMNLIQLFENQVRLHPDNDAVISNDRIFSYRELDRIANGIAGWLLENQLQQNELVAIVMDKSWEQVAAVLGILKAGGAYLPIDAGNPTARMDTLLAEGNVRYVLTQPETKREFTQPQYSVLEISTLLSRENNSYSYARKLSGHDLAYVIYTSGSTGVPKGVMITHGGAVNTILDINEKFKVSSGDRVLAVSNLNFDLSVYDIFGMLAVGGAVVIPSDDKARDPEHWQELAAKYNVTVWNSVPALMKVFTDALPEPAANSPLPLRLILLSGDWIPVDLPETLRNTFSAPTVVGLGGATEVSIWSNYFICEEINPEWSSVPYGTPLRNQSYYILDEQMQNCPDWVPGELYIGGKGVASGYYCDEELTGKKFVLHPVSGERIYRTGDIGRYWPDGNIEFLGRMDSQVKINGYRIETGEIEAQLKTCGIVKDAVVMTRKTGMVNSLVSYIVTHDEDNRNKEYYMDYLRTKLPKYMIPQSYIMVTEIPLTDNGKIAYDKLPLPYAKAIRDEYQPVRTKVEQQLEHIWQTIFPDAQLGRNAGFFNLGGDSLQAIQLATQIRKDFGIEIGLDEVLKNPCLKDQAIAIGNASSAKRMEQLLPQIIPEPEKWNQEFPLTDIQQAYWVGSKGIYSLGNVSTKYYFEIEGENLDINRLNTEWNRLIKRHGMMRTVILPDGEHQKTLSVVESYKIKKIDLSGKDHAEIETVITAVRMEMSGREFDTGKWPLFEIRAALLPENKLRLHISFDNIVFDGYSMNQFLLEWSAAYYTPEQVFPKLDISFRDYVMTLEKIKETEIYQDDLRYWQNRLPEMAPAPELPLAQKPEQVKEQSFAHRENRLDAAAWQQLQRYAKEFGFTISAVLMTAYSEILCRWSKRPEFTLNLTRFNRLPLHPQIDDLIGDFTSITLLSIDHSLGDDFKSHCQHLQEQLWEDMNHSNISGIQVQRDLIREYGDEYEKGFPVIFTSALGTRSKGRAKALGKRVFGNSQTPQVWLDHQVMEEDGELLFSWDAVAALFPEGLLDDMFTSYCDLLTRLAGDKDLWIGNRQQLLAIPGMQLREKMNDTAVPGSEETLISLFEQQARKNPDAPAIRTDHRQITYGQLRDISNQIGTMLIERNTANHTFVAVVMKKGWEQVAAVLGVMKAGAAYVPIDADHPSERIHSLIKEADIQLVLTQKNIDLDTGTRASAEILCIDWSLSDSKLTVKTRPSKPDDTAYMIYTSGTTGKPKGVIITHRGAVNTIRDINTRFRLTADDCAFALSNLNFDLSVYDIFGMLAAGGTIAIPASEKIRDPRYWQQFMKQHRITVWNSVPAFMRMLVESHNESDDLTDIRLRLVMLSGDWIPVDLPERIRQLFGRILVVSLGGATEASIWSNYYLCDEIDPSWPSIPYGRPLDNQKYFILNEAMQDCPAWVPGQLYISGMGLASEYYHDEALTRDKFVSHPDTGERLYMTGDMGRYWADGNIEFMGRQDSQVKINGYRIETGEIEEAIKNIRGIDHAVVIPAGTEREKQLFGFVVYSGAPEALSSAADPAARAAWKQLIQRVAAVHAADSYVMDNTFVKDMDIASTNTIYKVLMELGLGQLHESPVTAAEGMKLLGIHEKYSGLFQHWIGMMIADGYGQYLPDKTILLKLPDKMKTYQNQERQADPAGRSNIERLEELFAKEIQIYIDLLKNNKNLLELYLDNDSLLLPNVLQQVTGSTEPESDLAEQVFAEILKQRPDSSGSEPGMILEIGTRVASLGRKIISQLPVACRYIYGDESLYFQEEKEAEIGSAANIEFSQMDLTKEELPGQLEDKLFDIVIANNALHRFPNVNTLLRHINKLLKPDGILLFTENTDNSSTLINTIGMLEDGFCHYTDERQNKKLPLLHRAEWEEALDQAGFHDYQLYQKGERDSIIGIASGCRAQQITPRDRNYIPKELSKKLPKYMIPHQFQELERLPLTPNGKINYRVLEKIAVEQRRTVDDADYELPVSDTEQKLAEIWKKILKSASVYRDSEFFKLGGDSLSAIQCVNSIKAEFGVELPLKVFYEVTTLKRISAEIDQNLAEIEEEESEELVI